MSFFFCPQQVELHFKMGQTIFIYGEMDDDGFYRGECNGVRGLVPSNFLMEVGAEYGPEDGVGPPPQNKGQRQSQQQQHHQQSQQQQQLQQQQDMRGHGPGARGPPPPPRGIDQPPKRSKGTHAAGKRYDPHPHPRATIRPTSHPRCDSLYPLSPSPPDRSRRDGTRV